MHSAVISGSARKTSDPISYEEARGLLGQNFFGPEQYASFLSVEIPRERLDECGRFPCSADKLHRLSETHFGFLGLPKAGKFVFTLENLAPSGALYGGLRIDGKFLGGKFAHASCMPQWYLLPLDPLLQSPETNELPPTIVQVVMHLFARRRQARILPGHFMTSDRNEVGVPIMVLSDQSGISVKLFEDGRHGY